MDESKFALKYGLGAGFLGALCCIGPIIPILLGVGGGAALFGLDQYKPWFLILGLMVLAGASWYAVRKRNQCCTTKNRFKDAQIVGMIFGVGIVTYGLMFYGVVPVLANVAANKVETSQSSNTTINTTSLELNVEGMTCAGCSVGVKKALLEVPGVIQADVDWQTGKAHVEYDRNQTSEADILKAKIQEQYNLTVAPASSSQ